MVDNSGKISVPPPPTAVSHDGPHARRWIRAPTKRCTVLVHHSSFHPAPLSYVRCADGEPPLIPLKIHHIWLGSPLPEAFARLRESWLARHVGHSGQGRGQERGNGSSTPWEVRLWTDADINAFGLENRGAFDAAQNFGQKSDILRYEVGRV